MSILHTNEPLRLMGANYWQSRLVEDAEPRLYEDLKWAGLTWDEGGFTRSSKELDVDPTNMIHRT